MKEHMIFRVDGGNVYSIAMGHIYRCLKVAKTIAERKTGVCITFVMKDYKAGVKKIQSEGFKVVQISQKWTLKKEIDFIDEFTKEFTTKIFISDIRNINNKYIETVRNNGGCFIYFDDLGGHSLKPDVIINSSVTKSLQKYPCYNRKTDYYVGKKYFIIDRKIFLKPMNTLKKEIMHIIISFGGADPSNITCNVLKTLVKLHTKIHINVILGPAYNHHRELNNLMEKNRRDITIKTNVKNMYNEMINADIGITSGGDTCLEMVYTGIPTIVIPSIWYEEETAWYLAERGAAECVYLNEVNENLLNRIDDLIRDYPKRKSLSIKGKKLIDGKGIERVFTIINNRMEKKD